MKWGGQQKQENGNFHGISNLALQICQLLRDSSYSVANRSKISSLHLATYLCPYTSSTRIPTLIIWQEQAGINHR